MYKVEINDLKKFEENYEKNNTLKVSTNAVINNGINNTALNKQEIDKCPNIFNINVKTGKISNQKQSGRCWLFAGLNMLRNKLMEKYNLDDFAFSQIYLTFFDKLEKANFFLNKIVETRNLDISSREIEYYLNNAAADGGEWSYFVNLVKKYGVIPQYLMKETVSSESTSNLNFILNAKLREDALILRESKEENLDELVKDMLSDIYNILTVCFGKPITNFDFEYNDKDNNYYIVKNLTPLKFYEDFIGLDLEEFVNVTNIETEKIFLNNVYESEFVNNMIGGKNIQLVNTTISNIKSALINSLKDNQICWFACDVLTLANFTKGVMSCNLYDYGDLFQTKFSMNKKQRATTKFSTCNHAMAFTGVNVLDDGTTNRWKVENSWCDKDNTNNGYFVMSDDYFNEYVYEVIINKKYLNEETLKLLDQKPILLKPWELI